MKDVLNKYGKIVVFSFGIMAFVLLVWSLIYFDSFQYLRTLLYKGGLNTSDRLPRAILEAYFGPDAAQEGGAWYIVHDFYTFAQKFNQSFHIFTIVMLVLFAVLLVAANHSRKKFYLSNLFFGVTISFTAIIYAIVILFKNGSVMGMFNDTYAYTKIYDLIGRLTQVVALGYVHDGTIDNYIVLSSYNITITNVLLILFIAIAVLNLVYTILKFAYSKREVEL